MTKPAKTKPPSRKIDGKAPTVAATGLAKVDGTRRVGAPRANRNAIRHGLSCGRLPKGAKFIEVRVNVFRRHLEDEVIRAKGEITMCDASLIDTACKWVRHERLAHRWLEKKYDELKPDQLLTFSREIARASTERDKAIRALGLDKHDNRVIDVLYKEPRE